MSKWIQLNREEFDKGETQSFENGVEVTVFLSPYDIPKAVRGEYQANLKQFVIEFRYLSDSDQPTEPMKETEVDSNFRFYDGKFSHRIYRIEIDVDKLKTDGVQLQVGVVEALEEFDKHDRPKNRGRYDVNREVIERQKEDLFRDMVVAP